jgi:hypothetical protein
MKVKPKEIMVDLPAAHLFSSEDEMAQFASAINTIIHGKVKVKYDVLGILGGRYVGLFYVQRNLEFGEIHDEFIRLIEQEEMAASQVTVGDEVLSEDEAEEVENKHGFCMDCDEYVMLHHKGLHHCWCGGDWINGKCEMTNA